MEIYINKIHYPVLNLGNGRRLGIWLQGCTIRCRGCVNPDTWQFSENKKIEIGAFLEALSVFSEKRIDGITITGGEPFDQPIALHELLKGLRAFTAGDILVYSGYDYRKLRLKYPEILKSIDVVVTGPFMIDKTDKLIWRGSDNQKFHLLSDLSRSIYPDGIDRMEWGERRMQYSVVGDVIYMIGIPPRHALEKFYEKMKSKGIDCNGAK